MGCERIKHLCMLFILLVHKANRTRQSQGGPLLHFPSIHPSWNELRIAPIHTWPQVPAPVKGAPVPSLMGRGGWSLAKLLKVAAALGRGWSPEQIKQ